MSNARDIRSDSAEGSVRPLNARSLALSVLLGTHPPVLPGRALVSIAELFGFAGGTMRTALSRLVAAGEVELDEGRYRLVGALLDRQLAQDAGRRSHVGHWSGDWHTVIVVDDRRPLVERRRFRTLMSDHRFGELRPDIWLRPANLPAPPAGPGWIVVSGRLAGDEPGVIAGRLWDLADLGARAGALLDRLDVLRRTLDWTDPASIPPVFTASAAVVRLLRSEPMLPPALATETWSVAELRSAYDVIEHDLQTALRAYIRTRSDRARIR